MRGRALAFAGMLGALGVGLDAIGAHVLLPTLAPGAMDTYATAVRYLLLHAVLLVGLALAAPGIGNRRAFGLLLCAFAIGTLLFSGGLLGWVLQGWAWARAAAPWGGSLLILAWAGLGIFGLAARYLKGDGG